MTFTTTDCRITNLLTTPLSLDVKFDDDRILRTTLAANGGTTLVGSLASFEEVNRNEALTALRTGSSPKISITFIRGSDDIPGAGPTTIATKDPVRLCSNGALAANTASGLRLIADAVGALTIDGSAAAANDRVLIKDEAAGANNGIYTVEVAGDGSTRWQLLRAADFDSSADAVPGSVVYVTEGAAAPGGNADTFWALTTNAPVVLGTTALTFVEAPVGFAVGGDLSGSLPNPTVVGLRGDALPANAANIFVKRNAANNAWEAVTYGSGANSVMQGDDSRAPYPVCRLLATTEIVVGAGAGQYTWDAPTQTLTENDATGAQLLDGLAVVDGDRVMLNLGLINTIQNGIFVVSGVGAAVVFTRASDMNADAEVVLGRTVWVTAGGAYAGSRWDLAVKPAALDTNVLGWLEQVQRTGATARTACAGNDARLPTADQKAALAGTSGTPAAANPYVTTEDGRVQQHKVPAAVRTAASLAPDFGWLAGVFTEAVPAGVIYVLNGVNLTLGTRVLVADQVAGAENGLYEVTQEGGAGPTATILARVADLNGMGEAPEGLLVYVAAGAAFANTLWSATTVPGAGGYDVDPFVFAPVPVDAAPAAHRFGKWNAAGTARESVTYGTAANTVAQGNDGRFLGSLLNPRVETFAQQGGGGIPALGGAAAGSFTTITGANFLQGLACAQVDVGVGPGIIRMYANDPGAPNNSYSLSVTDGGPAAPIVFTWTPAVFPLVSNLDISCDIAAGATTVAAVIVAWNALVVNTYGELANGKRFVDLYQVGAGPIEVSLAVNAVGGSAAGGIDVLVGGVQQAAYLRSPSNPALANTLIVETAAVGAAGTFTALAVQTTSALAVVYDGRPVTAQLA